MVARWPSESVAVAVWLVSCIVASHLVGSCGCVLVAFTFPMAGVTGVGWVETLAVGPTVAHGGDFGWRGSSGGWGCTVWAMCVGTGGGRGTCSSGGGIGCSLSLEELGDLGKAVGYGGCGDAGIGGGDGACFNHIGLVVSFNCVVVSVNGVGSVVSCCGSGGFSLAFLFGFTEKGPEVVEGLVGGVSFFPIADG